jgi:hypothetical protein
MLGGEITNTEGTDGYGKRKIAINYYSFDNLESPVKIRG